MPKRKALFQLSNRQKRRLVQNETNEALQTIYCDDFGDTIETQVYVYFFELCNKINVKI